MDENSGAHETPPNNSVNGVKLSGDKKLTARIGTKKRPKHKLSEKQVKLVEGLTRFDSVTAAGKSAGYNTRQAAHAAMKQIRESAPEALERLGGGRDRVFKRLIGLLDAKKKTRYADKGIVMTTVVDEDNDLAFRAGVELSKMHGAYPKGDNGDLDLNRGGITINLGVFNSPAAAALRASVRREDEPVVLDAEVHKDS